MAHELTPEATKAYIEALEACYKWDREEYQSNRKLIKAVEATKRAYYNDSEPPCTCAHGATCPAHAQEKGDSG